MVILDSRQESARRAEIHQQPGRHSGKSENPPQHADLPLIQVGLVLLGPAGVDGAAIAIRGTRAEFTDDEWLVVGHLPLDLSGVFGTSLIPAQVLVEADHIQKLS